MSKSKQLRELLYGNTLEVLLEAHDGVSARIVEESGFKGIWASGLTISTALGHRDCNELSWTQMSAQWEFMAEATNIPILVDADTGYGNFNQTRLLVNKLCSLGIAGACIEDKVFPKTNSFIGEGQTLASIKEFCGKIRAVKDSQRDESFCLIARTETFIAGRGLNEALERAYAYEHAGADALLIHSKQKSPSEIAAFCSRWEGKIPLVIVPTTYADTPFEEFEKMGISLVIWANHLLRAAVASMRNAASAIAKTGSVAGLELASVQDLFALNNEEELRSAEALYLP